MSTTTEQRPVPDFAKPVVDAATALVREFLDKGCDVVEPHALLLGESGVFIFPVSTSGGGMDQFPGAIRNAAELLNASCVVFFSETRALPDVEPHEVVLFMLHTHDAIWTATPAIRQSPAGRLIDAPAFAMLRDGDECGSLADLMPPMH
ncbi:hypothetical protein [Cupriavidus oxalaticus]|uniref:Uncharacterized protein n=1 Tax=Cupriavidus oxalaticus TaxID=96344 RepID=A0A5P3VRT4_9BURK|nr:hypothetical protein [Cupriavidus oxalaticus]QEZ48950.1 hypothetical protein D2917_32330 [Cupriavidus oxalaticus]